MSSTLKKVVFIGGTGVFLFTAGFAALTNYTQTKIPAPQPQQPVLQNNKSLKTETQEAKNLPATCKPTAGTIEKDIVGLGVWISHSQGFHYLQDLGVTWVRMDLRWDLIEPEDGVLHIDQFDDEIDGFHKMGIQVLPIINHFPAWIQDYTTLNQRLSTLTTMLVERYKPGGLIAQTYGWGDYGIRYWEIFNEPNYSCCGWPIIPNAKEYTNVLATANAAIRKADPQAIILFGGLSPGGEINPYEFLTMSYQLGAKNCFDVLTFHPYMPPEQWPAALEKLKDIAKIYGDENKPIWFNEFGTTEQVKELELMDKAFQHKKIVSGFIWHEFGRLLTSDFLPHEPYYSHFKNLIQQDKATK